MKRFISDIIKPEDEPAKRLVIRIYFFVFIVLLLSLSAVRYDIFGHIEPRMDQAMNITWVQSIFQAERFLPQPLTGRSWLAALEADSKSFLHALLKPIYIAPTLIFVSGSIAWFSIGGLLSGVSAESQIGWSIAANGGMLLLLAILPFSIIKSQFIGYWEALSIGTLLVFIAASSSFLNAFSPLGIHNVGLLALIGATFVISRYLSQRKQAMSGMRPLLWAITAQAIACYTMYANVFLLPVATTLVLFFDFSLRPRQRMVDACQFAGLTLISFMPALVLLGISLARPHFSDNSGTFGEMTRWAFSGEGVGVLPYLSSNFFAWFQHQSEAFTQIGLLLGLIGLILFTVRFKQPLPLGIVVAHLLASTLIGQFSGQSSRTSAYVLPFLSLGFATLIVTLARYAISPPKPSGKLIFRLLFVLVILATGLRMAQELPGLSNPQQAKTWGPYYANQGQWHPLVTDIEAQLPTQSVLIPWDISISYTFRSLQNQRLQNIQVLQPLFTLNKRNLQGSLRTYIQRRRISIPPKSGIFLLIPATIAVEQVASIATKTLCGSQLRRCQQAKLSKLDEWPAERGYGGRLILYAMN